MADRGNTEEHWNTIWGNPRRRTERYCMDRTLQQIKVTGAKRVLDLGCGTGKMLHQAKIVYGCFCFGVDISRLAIERMEKEYGINGLVLDIYNLGELHETFDFISINHTLEHLYRDREVVMLCKDKLTLGGTFFASVPNNMSGPEETEEHVRKYNKETFVQLIEEVFGNCKVEIIGHHLIGIAKKL